MNVIRNNLLFLSLLVLSVSCTTFYVSPNGNDSNNGKSETTPFKTIQTAVYAADDPTVILMPGIYNGTDNSQISINGDVTVIAQPGVTVSCLGTSNTAAFQFTWWSVNSSLAGFTIQDCEYGVYFEQGSFTRFGGFDNMVFRNLQYGIAHEEANVTVTNSRFENVHNGIVTLFGDDSVTVDNCSFYNVTSFAIYATTCIGPYNISNSVFTFGKNSAITSQFCHILINNCTFAQNVANSGAAIFANQSSIIEINSSSFFANTAKIQGGAITLYDGSVLITNNTEFTKNSAQNGGAISTAGTINIFNSAFTSNKASGYGGAFICDQSENLLSNVLFSLNTAAKGPAFYCNKCVTLGKDVVVHGESGNCPLIPFN